MRKASFKVLGLHCSDEIALLKKVIGEKKGIKTLDFDLIKEKMEVTFDEKFISSEEIVGSVKATGLKAVAWENRHLISEKMRRLRFLKLLSTLFAAL